METGWKNSFSGDGGGDDSGVQNTNTTWGDIWDISSGVTTPPPGTRYDWTNTPATASARVPEASVIHALLYNNTTTFFDARQQRSNSVDRRKPDPHMMCLKLGKRHYCEDAVVPAEAESSSATKRGKQDVGDSSITFTGGATTSAVWAASSISPGGRVTSVARCQVEGCHVVLANAKEYYRRHKVCEIHSKSPNVVVLGLQQRFCQQCSRFHGVGEFDEAKRSCRRRLEGHNQRRRKGSLPNSFPRNFPHPHEENNCMIERRLRPLPPSPPESKPGCALSLLSSSKTEPWISTSDLSSRCSAALYELIAANRATCVTGHLLNQNSFCHSDTGSTTHAQHNPQNQMWDRFTDQTTMTLDLMQAPALDFGLMSMKDKSKDPDEWTDYCWSTFGGANIV